ncbi:MAG: glycoside hydrolase family 3 protein [Alphaproteobacteria bacterium]
MKHILGSLIMALAFATTAQASTKAEKIGQMIMVGFDGTKPGDLGVKKVIGQIRAGKVGGVILFKYNIETPDQVKALTTVLHEAAGDRKLLVAVDQEGGRVQRLRFTEYKKPLEVAAEMSPEQAEAYYETMAQELNDLGINVNFGPVVDLHGDGCCPVIGKLGRSFGNSPETVAAYANAFVRAHRKHGILTSGKHYPGHGLATMDSHEGKVDVTDSFQQKEREPFRMVNSPMVMVSHVMLRDHDPQHPASLSPAIIQNWLRQEDGFQGVVITDDLHMGAIGQHYGFEGTVLQAVNAGVDIILFSNNHLAAKGVDNPHITGTIAEQIADIVTASEDISDERIEASYERIKKMKTIL